MFGLPVIVAILFLIAVLLAVAFLVASAKAVRAANLQSVYRRLADQYHGQVEQNGAFGWPVARIVHRDISASITCIKPWGALSQRETQVVVWESPLLEYAHDESSPFPVSFVQQAAAKKNPLASVRCEISPAGFLQRMAYFVGSRRPITDSPQFDLQYAITTDDPEHARRLLTRYVQMQIDRLRYLHAGNDVYVLFEAGVVTVRRRGVIRNERVLRQFVAHSIELYEQAAASFAVGIDLLELSGHNGADAVCKVCGDRLDGEEVVYCRLCDTPHHRDCWRYFGGCSVYACGERRYTRAPRTRAG